MNHSREHGGCVECCKMGVCEDMELDTHNHAEEIDGARAACIIWDHEKVHESAKPETAKLCSKKKGREKKRRIGKFVQHGH